MIIVKRIVSSNSGSSILRPVDLQIIPLAIVSIYCSTKDSVTSKFIIDMQGITVKLYTQSCGSLINYSNLSPTEKSYNTNLLDNKIRESSPVSYCKLIVLPRRIHVHISLDNM